MLNKKYFMPSSKTNNHKNSDFIAIHGARVNNLKNINVNIPKNKLVVITGVSGSGKSSLAFDTIYAEGQRRYLDSISSYARQFAALKDKPDVDQISGLSPAIAIDQKTAARNPRSTVGTMTEIHDYLRLLMARLGHPHCPICGSEVIQKNINEIINELKNFFNHQEVYFLTPIAQQKKGLSQKILAELKKAGFKIIRLNKEFLSIDEAQLLPFDSDKKYDLDVVTGTFNINNEPLKKNNLTSNIFEKELNTALELGNGFVSLFSLKTKEEKMFSLHLSCPACHFQLPAIEPRLFSFNSPLGACPVCAGLGVKEQVDPDLVIPNKKLTLAEGAIRPWVRALAKTNARLNEDLAKAASRHGFTMHIPVAKLTKKQLDVVLYGDDLFSGVIPSLVHKYAAADTDYMKSELERYMRFSVCPTCQGSRLNKTALSVLLAGKNMAQITELNLLILNNFLSTLKLSTTEALIAKPLIKEISQRLHCLCQVGLSYLSLARSAETLSGGEAQRVRLATQTSSGLSGIIYVLDEPSIGLHQKDNEQLITTLKDLRASGNSVIVVEHDKATMLASDWLIDIGPGAGKHGGEIIAEGTPIQIKNNKNSLTGAYLANRLEILTATKRHKGNGKFLMIKKAKAFNLKNIDVKIPLGVLVSITGVSGSGKSTLITEILSKALSHYFYQAKDLPAAHEKIIGLENLDKVITVDQSPIGRTPRSNPATYTGAFTYIRDLFANLPEAKIKRFEPGSFSFNVIGGRCEACQGEGAVKIEMNFMPDVYRLCEVCQGKRFKNEILDIHYHGQNIADILQMTVEEAGDFFRGNPFITAKMKTLAEVGLGYLPLGQPANTLSGGEAQRIKLATELSRRATGRTLYILDEPTTGLHFDDIKKLLLILQKLVVKGNSVLIIEHNLDVIKNSDWVIDLGPEGGDKGGYLVAEGTPEQVAKVKKSWTGKYLKEVL